MIFLFETLRSDFEERIVRRLHQFKKLILNNEEINYLNYINILRLDDSNLSNFSSKSYITSN